MVAVEIRLLTGRYAAAASHDRQAAEWPPHPARLFSAMVAVWAESGGCPEERRALEWLQEQPPPQIIASVHQDVLRRQIVTHFVPGNDATATRNIHELGVKISAAVLAVAESDGVKGQAAARRGLMKLQTKAKEDSESATRARTVSADQADKVLELLPDNRNRQARYFPAVRPADDRVTFDWSGAVPSADLLESLDGLLARVGRLGHSSSLVSCRMLTEPAAAGEHRRRFVPGPRAGGGRQWPVRVLVPDLLEELELSFASHHGVEPRSLPSVHATYTLAGVPRAEWVRPTTAGKWWVFALPAEARLRVTKVVDLTRLLRRAIMSHAADPLPPVLTGHEAPPGTLHAQWWGLPQVGSPHSDGYLAALVLAVPATASHEEMAAIEHGVDSFVVGGSSLRWDSRDVRVEVTSTVATQAESVGSRAVQRGYWSGPASVWRTVTPVALDRFPRALRSAARSAGDELDAEITQIVAKSCRDIGLPGPTSVRQVLGSPVAGIPPVVSRGGGGRGQGRFSMFRASSGQVRYTTHLEVEFDEPVAGPMALGAGRHFGYGLLFPVRQTRRGVREEGR